MERLKNDGEKNSKGSWMDSFRAIFSNLSSKALRKASKMVQANLFTSMAPAAAMLSLAIMGGTATLPWKTDLNWSVFIPPIAAVLVPFLLDNMASSIEKS